MSIYLDSLKVNTDSRFGLGEFEISNLKDITVILGKNGSGKSVLLRAWRDTKRDFSHYIVPERTGELDFQPQFLQEEVNGSVRSNSSVRNFTQDYRRRIVSRIQTYFMKRGNWRQEVSAPGNPEKIEEMLNILLPDFSFNLSADQNPPFKITRNENGSQVNHVDQLSSGEAQLISLGLDMLTIASIWEIESNPERILLIDEPDAHIHSDLQVRFADFIIKLSIEFSLQIAVATHSTPLLSALIQFGKEKTGILFLEKTKKQYSVKSPSEVMTELASCLGGHVLMGHLFNAPLLLVEGDDDYRIWSQVPRHHVISLAVIPCSGADQVKKYQKNLEQIFSCLHDRPSVPIGIALLDGDQSLPQNDPNAPQNFVKYLRLSCRESENLYLSDEVLQKIGLTWEDATDLIIAGADQYPNKKEELLNVKNWDKKNKDLKGLIEPISKLIDSKNVNWTTRVSSVIGSAKPSGNIANFLGFELVDFLWR